MRLEDIIERDIEARRRRLHERYQPILGRDEPLPSPKLLTSALIGQRVCRNPWATVTTPVWGTVTGHTGLMWEITWDDSPQWPELAHDHNMRGYFRDTEDTPMDRTPKAIKRHGPQPGCERVRCFGRAGHVAGWNVLIRGDAIHFAREHEIGEGLGLIRRHEVPNHGTGIGELAARPGFRVGWAQMPDDAEILYFYDRDDDGFGYALNATDPRRRSDQGWQRGADSHHLGSNHPELRRMRCRFPGRGHPPVRPHHRHRRRGLQPGHGAVRVDRRHERALGRRGARVLRLRRLPEAPYPRTRGDNRVRGVHAMTAEERLHAAEQALDAMARAFPAIPRAPALQPGFVPGEFEVQCEICGEWLPEWDEPETWHVYDDDHIAHDACWQRRNTMGMSADNSASHDLLDMLAERRDFWRESCQLFPEDNDEAIGICAEADRWAEAYETAVALAQFWNDHNTD